MNTALAILIPLLVKTAMEIFDIEFEDPEPGSGKKKKATLLGRSGCS